jgi:hypothetical protein
LYPYHQSTEIYHCPTDKGVVIGGKPVASVRSYSMNSFMGARASDAAIPNFATQYVPFYAKDSALRRPSSLWVLLDEDERSINDGFFVPDPTGRLWVDLPANSSHRHNFSYALNFADGHSEIWRHRDPRTRNLSQSRIEQANNPDLKRLAASSATLK